MGLSASQARLLSITARLSDNELHSQQIANSKVRLADKTQEASREYIEALNATKLMYTTYDSTGRATQTSLTPALLYEYSDLKNQYGISNTSGQLLVNSKDAANFEASSNVSEFVQRYGIELIDNPMYDIGLKSLYGQEYENFLGNDGLNMFNPDAVSWANSWNVNMSEDEYIAWKSQIINVKNSVGDISSASGSLYGRLIEKLDTVPDMAGDEPVMPSVPQMPDFATLAVTYNGSACYGSVNTTKSGIGHMEHNLAAIIWSIDGFGTDSNSITNSDGTITINNMKSSCNTGKGISLTNYSSLNDVNNVGVNLIKGLREASDYECVQDIVQRVIDLYCDVINYMNNNNQGSNTTDLDSSAFTMTSTASVKSSEQLYNEWKQFYSDLASLNEAGAKEYEEKVAEIKKEFIIVHNQWENNINYAALWKQECQLLFDKYTDSLKNLPMAKVPNEKDSEAAWYVNLWHRMNGDSDYKSFAGENGTYYKQLDDNLLTNADWLKFALEHGVVTMEKVQFVDEAENTTGLKNSKWQSTLYSSCVDISTVDDEIAIARAEAEYTRKLNEIEAKDKKYDNDIKKLDTEHNALQTEYESVKGVIDKNVERSFKAFS